MDNESRIAERAADYFARRHGETLSQRREREAWLAEDARHVRAYDDMQRLWDRVGGLRTSAALQTLKQADLAALQAERRRHRTIAWFAAAALVVLLLGGIWQFAWFPLSAEPAKFATQFGERRAETLADGSRIVLNTDSVLEARYTRGERDVVLQKGEAQFDVTHDASRPFVVQVGASSVTALGTRFQVRREDAAVIVTLLQGSVQIAHGQMRRVLHPNEQARLTGNAGIRVDAVDPTQVNGWLDGWLRFRDATLAEVVAEANRYSPRKLRLGATGLAALRLSGNFRAGDVAAIAAVTQQILPVRVDDRGTELVLQPK